MKVSLYANLTKYGSMARFLLLDRAKTESGLHSGREVVSFGCSTETKAHTSF